MMAIERRVDISLYSADWNYIKIDKSSTQEALGRDEQKKRLQEYPNTEKLQRLWSLEIEEFYKQ